MAYEYLAGPYTGNEEANVQHHAKALHRLLSEGRIVFSPIVHCHNLAVEFDMPTNFTYWHRYSFAMLGPASKILVLRIPGWQDSLGLLAEMAFADSLGIAREDIYPTD